MYTMNYPKPKNDIQVVVTDTENKIQEAVADFDNNMPAPWKKDDDDMQELEDEDDNLSIPDENEWSTQLAMSSKKNVYKEPTQLSLFSLDNKDPTQLTLFSIDKELSQSSFLSLDNDNKKSTQKARGKSGYKDNKWRLLRKMNIKDITPVSISSEETKDIGTQTTDDKTEVINQETGKKIEYVFTESTDKIYEHLKKKWGTPELVISINGGAKNMVKLNRDQKEAIKTAISNLTKRGNIWIVTAGYNVGVMKLIGSVAKRQLILNHGENNFKLIGIITNNKIEKTTCESLSDGVRISETILNQYHDFFIEYKHDKNNKAQVISRVQFEKEISETDDCPVVQVIIDGGCSTIPIAAEVLKLYIPIVVIKNSNRAADEICKILESPNTDIKGPKEQELKIIRKRSKLVRILLISKIAKELDLEILKAAFKGTKYKHQKKDMKTEQKEDDITIKLKEKDKKTEQEKDDKKDKIRKESTKIKLKEKNRKCKKDDDCRYRLLKLQMYYSRFDIESENIVELLNEYKHKESQLVRKAWQENLFQSMLLLQKNGINIIDHLKVSLEKENNQTSVKKTKKKNQKSVKENDKNNQTSIEKTEISTQTTNNKTEMGIQVSEKTIDLYKNLSPKEREYVNVLKGKSKEKERFKKLTKSIYFTDAKTITSYQGLFILCLILQRFEMAKVIWSSSPKDFTNLALLGAVVCTTLARKANTKSAEKAKLEFLKQKDEYLAKACGVLTEVYNQDRNMALSLVIKPFNSERANTAMEIADQNDLTSFLNHEVCQSKLNDIWYKTLLPSSTKHWLIPSLLCPLLLFSPKIKIDESKNNKNAVTSKNNNYKEKFQIFYSAPVTKFMITMTSYIVFLVLYTYVCLSELRPGPWRYRVGEFLAYTFLFSFFGEEFYQCFNSKETGKCATKIKKWLKSHWNKLDLFIFLEFCLAFGLRHAPLNFIYARTLYCFSLSLFYIRFMQFYLPDTSLGPKVIMIGHMVKDVAFFLAIYAIGVFAYGTFAQGLLFSNHAFNWHLLKAIVYNPYWQTYGELQLEYVEGKEKLDNTYPTHNAMVVFGFALFMLASNILLLNLLIAMFGNTFSKIESVAYDIWAYNRYQLVKEYDEKPIAPPPFGIFEIIIRLIHKKITKTSREANRAKLAKETDIEKIKEKMLEKKFSFKHETYTKYVERFEKECLKLYLSKAPILRNASDAEMRKSILEEISSNPLELETSKFGEMINQYKNDIQLKKMGISVDLQERLQKILDDNRQKSNDLKDKDANLLMSKWENDMLKSDLNLYKRKVKQTNEKLEKSKTEFIALKTSVHRKELGDV